MNKLDLDYQNLLKDILENGTIKQTRNGSTISVFGRQIRHKMSEGFPLLTTKKMYWRGIVTELLWFLRGDTNIKFLVDNDCHIWDGDAYKNYVIKVNMQPGVSIGGFLTQEEFIKKIKTDRMFAFEWGELGPVYGKQWRDWGKKTVIAFGVEHWIKGIDQIKNLINNLKTNPDSRRLMVNAWNVGELNQMVLPPCHYGFQVYTRELSLEERKQIFEDKGYVCDLWPFNGDWHGEYDGFGISRRAISLMWNQRSVDVGLGLPFNVASYALLLEILAKITNMVPDQLIGSLGDTHLYNNHIELVKEQIDREPFELPTLKIEKTNEFWNGFDVSMFTHLDVNDFTVENYQSHPTIKLPLSN